jgi:hypothetical protein
VDTIAAYYLREMRRVQPTGPFFLGGYSFGGVVALEVARQARSVGDHVGLLVLLDPPSLARSRGLAERVNGDRAGVSMSGVGRHLHHLAGLSFGGQLAYMQQRAMVGLSSLSGVPATKRVFQRSISRACAAARLRLPVFARSRYILDVYARALCRYVPVAYSGAAVLFKGIDRRYEPSGDWPELLLTADLRTHEVDASHTEMREGRFVGLWADKLREALWDAQLEVGRAPRAAASRTASTDEMTPSLTH